MISFVPSPTYSNLLKHVVDTLCKNFVSNAVNQFLRFEQMYSSIKVNIDRILKLVKIRII